MSKKTGYAKLKANLSNGPYHYKKIGAGLFEIWGSREFICTLTYGKNKLWGATHNSVTEHCSYATPLEAIAWYRRRGQ